MPTPSTLLGGRRRCSPRPQCATPSSRSKPLAGPSPGRPHVTRTHSTARHGARQRRCVTDPTLLTTYYLPLTADYLLPTTYCLLTSRVTGSTRDGAARRLGASSWEGGARWARSSSRTRRYHSSTSPSATRPKMARARPSSSARLRCPSPPCARECDA
eukprot:scaffold9813_cov56-Phaeocystis_antarctica.AAC.4